MTAEHELPDASGDRLVHSATALLISNATGAALGVAFWAVAARLYKPEDVGDGVAAISAMVLLASLAQLNLSIIFPRYLHAAGAKAPRMLAFGYAASSVAAIAASLIFINFTGYHEFLSHGRWQTVAFVAAVVLWVIFSIEDAALVGLRATFWVPVENTSFSAAKIVLLPIFAALATSSGVFYSWVLPVIACVVPINYYLFRRALPRHVRWAEGRASFPSRRIVSTVLLGEYAGSVAYIALATIPALLVAGQLGTTQAAYFQPPWLVGTSFDFLLFSIATSLVAESSARPGHAAEGVRRAVKMAVVLLLPGMVALVLLAPYLLGVLGADYAHAGTRLLQLLALTLPFLAVNVLYVTLARLARRVRRIVAVQVVTAAIVLGVSAELLSTHGITAVGIGFLVGQAAVAVVVLPSVVRQYRRADMAPDFSEDAELVAPSSAAADAAVEGAPEPGPAEGEATSRPLALGRAPQRREEPTGPTNETPEGGAR